MPLIRRFAVAALLVAASLGRAAAPPVGVDCARVSALLQALDDDDFDTRQSADEELRGMGRAVVAYLQEEHLRTPSPEVKARLGFMIRDLTLGERIPELVKMLSHADGRFRSHAEVTLRKVSVEDLPALEAELVKGRPECRRIIQRIIADVSANR
jgi:hypothetical protein